MSKELLAKFITLALLLGIVGFTFLRNRAVQMPLSSAPAGSTPQDTIYRMLDAARAGDVKAYVSHYSGPMAASLRQAIIERTEAGFREYLQTSNASIKGVAVMEPKPVSDREAELRVEYVYEDRNEGQTMYLEKQSDGWKISRVDSAERVKTPVPYGTPVQ